MSTLLTLIEVSERTRLPIATLRWYRQNRRGPASARVGSRVLYRAEDVDAWIDAQFAAERGEVA